MVVGRTGIKPCRVEAGTVGRVRELLSLECDAISHPVQVAVFADQGAIEEIPRIYLQAGFGGPHLEHTSRARLLQPGRQFWIASEAGVERKIVVIAAAGHDLRIMSVTNAIIDRSAASEVENRTTHAAQFTRRNEPRVDRRVVARGNGESLSLQALHGAFTRQVEDAVIGEVDHG